MLRSRGSSRSEVRLTAVSLTAPPPNARATVLDFQRRTLELVADAVVPIDEGWVVRTPSLPAVWTLNHVLDTTAVTYRQAHALCQKHLPDAGFEQLFVEHEATGAGLAETFRGHGWEVDTEVHMALARPPDRESQADAIIEPGVEDTLSLMARWMREDDTLHLTEAGVRQLVESNRVTWGVRNATRLGVRGAAGELVAITMLYSDGVVAQVEDVYTVPEARGRGHARRLVSAAAELARARGHELTFIVADDNDWPKQLYAKLGFEPVARTWLFHREPGTGVA